MRTDADGLLAARFAATYDHYDGGDWAEVARRAAPVIAWRRPRVLVALAVFLVLVPTAIACRGAIRDLFFGSPAPPIIKRSFADQNKMQVLVRKWAAAHGRGPVAFMPRVDPSKAHGVISIRTSDGRLLLWAAPTYDGRECWFINFARDAIGHKRATGGGSCDQAKPPPGNLSWSTVWSAAHPTLKVLSGRVYVSDAVAVLANVGDGSPPVRVPVVDRYFLAAFPRQAKLPDAIAVDRKGRMVAGRKPG